MTMTPSPLNRCIALVITLLFTLTACTSLQGVPVPQEPGKTPAVKVGETVEVTNSKGETLRFRVTAIEADALVGKNIRVPYKEITTLQVERNDPAQTGGTLWIVGGVILTGLLIYALENTSPGIQE